MDVCTICYRPDNDPFRVYDVRGNVVLGCVGAAHDGRLVPISASSRWHNRRDARDLRRAHKGMAATVGV